MLLRHPDQWPHAIRRIVQALRDGRLFGALRDFSRTPAISVTSYKNWIKNCEMPLDEQQLHGVLNANDNPVGFSILMPVWNPDPSILQAAIDSVVAQTYLHWQLCIVDNGSNEKGIVELLQIAAQLHPNITLLLLDENSGISQATNMALEMANGDFVAFLDHDDLLTPDALSHMALALVNNPDAKLIYSDEDKIDETGHRFSPYFKPDFDAHLLLAQNYLCHFLAVSKKLANEAGGLRKAFDGAQDHDFILRCTEKLLPEQIIHVPHILYHWRAHTGSTALNIGAKTYAIDAGDRAVKEALKRRGIDNVQLFRLPNFYRQMQFDMPASPPAVTIIIPNKNHRDLLETCLKTLLEKTSYPDFEVIIVDNASDDPKTLQYLKTLDDRYPGRIQTIDYDPPFNYSDMNNQAARQARGEILCFLNNDIEIISGDWLGQLVGALEQPDVAVSGARLLFPDGSIQHNGILVGFGQTALNLGGRQLEDDPGYFGQMQLVREVSAVTGACMVTQKQDFIALGGFDANNFPVAFSDVDYCLRLRERGKKILICPSARLIHHESATMGPPSEANRLRQFENDRENFIKRWQNWIDYDPAYNPNLDLNVRPFTLAATKRTNLDPQNPDRKCRLKNVGLKTQIEKNGLSGTRD